MFTGLWLKKVASCPFIISGTAYQVSVAITDAVDTEDGCRPRDDSLAAAAVVVGTFFAVFGVFFEDLDAVDAGKAAPDGFHDASLG